jgi:hypothetical protein
MTKVYIWYPTDGNIGHASMHIGVDSNYHSNLRYVSWWPDGSASLVRPKVDAAPMTFSQDLAEEGSPHVTYNIDDSLLNVVEMEKFWFRYRTKPRAHYKLYDKNCSTTVARVLKAGKAQDRLGGFDKLFLTNKNIWTPKHVARWCDHIRAKYNGLVTKTNGPNKPGKSILPVLVGMR